ncbi:putative bifunctional diguanylate cyclase/phosphodiesterase [Paucibacter sp. DJ2R-2]|uniref:putative bifunctional diguanylate cyclase/phosphodiesterase n=1 Tax=Paucibacter sp. DJ2R-2 TaxID=2893558 RepID=UPI0021E4AC7A|nr:EAL domain-containing protein [Paucibacter sp. DJ2R-2]MCV2422009.1 EAL domain-containing protein [Paucibacter sp. DJ4R-1]MCV2439374.1 EAL domain-containing protein [Paucibacter sp. DJ2R-2]
MPDDDLIMLIDAETPDASPGQKPWRVLVIDDDDEVHRATQFAFRNAHILGRPMVLDHCYSASESRALLAQDKDYALVLLDVVMEDPQAGLSLVEYIRKDCQMHETRIILRTGQPGSAPELPIIEAYDINDYRTKSELTQTRLITAVTAALRSYEQIRTIAESRRGLELIVRSAADLMERHAMLSFAEGVLTQLAALLGLPKNGIVCVHRGQEKRGERADAFYVITAGGQFSDYLSCTLDTLGNSVVRTAVLKALQQRQHHFANDHTVLFLEADGHEAAVYIQSPLPLAPIDRQLVEVFATNISAYFGNVNLIGELNRLAFWDTLTGLANRSQFVRDIEAALQASSADHALLLLDIRRFAELNNGLGHDVGNALLTAIAQRLRAGFSSRTQVARLTGDVFGLVGPEDEVSAAQVGALFEEALQVGEHHLSVAFSSGCYLLKQHQDSASAALRRASIALTGAKSSPQVMALQFEASMEAHTHKRLALLRRLRSDIQAGRLQLWYQPQLSMQGHELTGIEALMRWPEIGSASMVESPAVFVPLAEQSGLINALGRWALEQAAEDWCALQSLAGAPPRVSVNVSMPQFRSGELQTQVDQALAKQGMPASALELEITESMAMDEPELVIAALQGLRQRGVRVALDDFGTGYSSLAHLRALPIDVLKIDKSFVQQIGEPQGEVFVETVLSLGKRLGTEIIAEGVETEGQADFLRQQGCTTAQGWLYAKGMPLAELKAWMTARSAKA